MKKLFCLILTLISLKVPFAHSLEEPNASQEVYQLAYSGKTDENTYFLIYALNSSAGPTDFIIKMGKTPDTIEEVSCKAYSSQKGDIYKFETEQGAFILPAPFSVPTFNLEEMLEVTMHPPVLEENEFYLAYSGRINETT